MLTESGATIGLVAGEASGDNLGAALIARAARARRRGRASSASPARACRRRAATAWHSSDELAVMGLVEIAAPPAAAAACCGAKSCARMLDGAAATSSSASTRRNSTCGVAAALQARGHRDRAVREPAGLGLAPGARAHDRRVPSISCCACCRSRAEFYDAARRAAPCSSGTRSPTRFRCESRSGAGARARWACRHRAR